MNEITEKYIPDILERDSFLEDVQEAIMNKNEEFCKELLGFVMPEWIE